jgi:hypothetical protein
MDIVTGILVVIHLIGWALVLGGLATRMRKPEIPAGVWHGALTAVVTGLLLVGIAEMGDGDVNHVKIAVKLVVALAVLVLVWRGRRQSSVTTGYLGAIAGLTALNVAIAVLW